MRQQIKKSIFKKNNKKSVMTENCEDEYYRKRDMVKFLTNDYIKKIIKDNVDDEYFYSIINELPQKRMETTQQIRAFLLTCGYEASGGKNIKELAPVLAGVELLVASMYYENRIFDHKGEKHKSIHLIKKNIISGYFVRDLASESVKGLEEYFGKNKTQKVVDLINESDKIFQEGEFKDIFLNIYSKMKNNSFENQIDFCLERIYGINASYVEKCLKIGAILSTDDKKIINALGDFGRYFGIAAQIQNDIVDFVPSKFGYKTSEKIISDTYRDVMTEKMTLPIIYTLNKGSKDDIKYLINIFKKGLSCDEEEDLIPLTKMMAKNGSFNFADKYVKKYMNLAKKSLKEFFNKEQRINLSRATSVFYTSKYYKSLDEMINWRKAF